MNGFTPVSAIAGGALIGLAAVLLMLLIGRIAGISGIVNGAIHEHAGERAWRIAFLVGLVLGGTLVQFASETPLITRSEFPWWQLVAAGFLVGFGTRLGSGCTSGHGVCGIARFSSRSLAATGVFLSLGAVTATSIALLHGASL